MKRWTIRTLLAPPVFPGDENKTRRANLFNSAVLTLLALGLCIMAGNLAGGRVPVAVAGVDIVVFAACLVLRRWAYQGRIGLASGALLAIGLVAITVGIATLGTVRAPATAMYMLLVITAGLVFDLGGMIVMTVLSSLAIAGLIVAENAGLLPRPDYAVTITQWVTFTAIFAWAGSLTFSALQSMRQSLARADQDITERKRAEAALRESEARYRLLFENMQEGFALHEIITDETGNTIDFRFLDANAAYERHAGLKPQAIMGKTMREILPQADPRQIENYGKVALTGEPLVLEYFSKAFGRHLHIRAFCPQRGRFATIFEDITKRKQAEEALRESEERYRTTMMSVGDGVIATDTEGRVELLNPVAEALTGWRQEQARGKLLEEVWRIINQETRQPVENPVRRVMREGLVVGLANHTVLIARDGTEHPLADSGAPIRDEKGEITGVVLVFRDQTQERAAQKALRVALTKYKALFESFPLGITVSDQAGKILESNPMAERLLGVPQAEHDQRAIDGEEWRIVRPDGTPMPAEEYASVRALEENRLVENVEMGIVKAHGEITWISVTAAPLPLEGYGVVITYGDITERKRAEEALRESEERFRIAAENASDLIWEWDIVNGKLEWFGAIDALLGYAPGEFPRTIDAWERVIHVDDRDRVMAALDQHLKTQSPYRQEYRVCRKDGTLGHWTDKGTAVCNGQGHPYKMIGVCTDITERKQVEELLQRREEHFRSLIENVSDLVMVMSSDRVIRYASPSTERVIGYKPEQLIGIAVFDFVHPDDVPALLDALSRIVQSPYMAQSFEHRLRHKDGSWRMVETVGKILYADAGATSVVVSSRDITERKQADEALRETRELLSNLLEHVPVSIYVTSADGRLRLVNQRWEQDTQKQREDVMGCPLDQVFPLQVARKLDADNQRVIDTGAPLAFEEVVGAPVEPHHFLTVKFPLHDAVGRVEAVGGFSVDITERKQAEDALRESEGRYRRFIDTSMEGFGEIGLDGRIISNNPQMEKLFGYSHDEMLGLSVIENLLFPDDRAALIERLQRRQHGHGEASTYEQRFRRKNGESMWAILSATPVKDESGNIISSFSMITDITARKQAEDAFQFTRYSIDSATETIVIVAKDGHFADVNNSFCRTSGYSRDELLSMTVQDIDPGPDYTKEMWSGFWELLKQRGSLTIETTHHTKEGKTYPVESTLTYFEYNGSEYHCGFARDITERKRAEESLQRLNRELALLNRASQTFNSTLDLDQVLAAVLEEVRQQLDVTACSVWLMDPATGGLICQQATGPQHEIVRGWRLAPGQGLAGWVARSGESLNVPDVCADERYFRGVDQQTGLLLRSVLTVPLRVKQGVIGVLEAVDTGIGRFSAADVRLLESLAATAAIAIENARLYDQVRRDAETKSVLLQEINHRVKNNLTAIIGLLYAKQRYARAEDRSAWQAIVQDLSNHIQGLAVVHSLLTATEWAPLSLSEMTSQVIHAALQMLPSSQSVSVDVAPSTAQVVAKQANSLALILNELTTNAAKYAASEDRTAHIGVRIVSDGGTLIEFRDDGPGFPDDVLRLERHNVGLYLVKLLVRDDLRGDVTLHNDGGAVITIRFKG